MATLRTLSAGLAAALATTTLAVLSPASATEPDTDDPDSRAGTGSIYLVTLTGPGTSGSGADLFAAARMHADQDAVLASIGGAEPVYRWTTALNGLAVRLSAEQAADLRADPRVALVERNAVRRLAGRPTATGVLGPGGAARGGAGVVVGLVDSGLWPDSPLFSAVGGLGRAPGAFTGACETGPGWSENACNGKVVGARWFVHGFGTDRLRSASSLSPLDDDGHGTQVASIVAGNAGVPARVRGQRVGSYTGVAPQARLGVYKACWSAPDPRNDGCASADLVAAIDAATADGVDVLNLSVGGPARIDTVARALLGATESGVVVVGAAGNAARSPAAHRDPWVTTVGATTGPERRGRVVLPDGVSYAGAMAATRGVGPARVVRGADAPARGATPRDARVCLPGSLDARRWWGGSCSASAAGRPRGQVRRGRPGRRIGMILANATPGDLVADFHRVPTVHVDRAAGAALDRWLTAHPRAEVRLDPRGVVRTPVRVATWSSPGSPRGTVVKPDLVATGAGVLGAVPPAGSGAGWDLLAGSSAAAAITSGTAALVRSRHPDWSPAAVRSALVTSARPVAGAGALRAGAGRVRPAAAVRPGLVYDVPAGDYRAWLDGGASGTSNTPSIRVEGAGSVERTVTNVSGRRLYFSSTAAGFAHHSVRVTPAALRLGPGESATFTVAVSPGAARADDGWVTWRGATGTVTRIPVVVTR